MSSFQNDVPQFYEGQAEVYDMTRNGLLKGRDTMLSLSAAHLRTLRASSPNKRLIWVDIGGGTGRSLRCL
jgi:betaine lipid synthase